MGYEQIIYEVKDQVATVTLNRPDKLNAFTRQMGREMRGAMDEAARDDAVRVIVLTGAGRGFCAGADMGLLSGISDAGAIPDDTDEPAQPPTDTAVRADFRGPYAYFPTIPKPIIAALNGATAGPGWSSRSTATCAWPAKPPSSPPRSRVAASSPSMASAGCCPT